MLFFQRENGEVVIDNVSINAIRKAQEAFAGAAEAMGIETEEDRRASLGRQSTPREG